MPQLQTYHVKSKDGVWTVEAEGGKRPSATESRKTDAVSRAKELAERQQPAKVIVYKQDGTVQDELTYGDIESAMPSRAHADGIRGNDAGYALAALANDALQLAGEAMHLARQLPARAQERAQQASEKAQERAQEFRDLHARREDLQQRVREFRDQAGERFEEKAEQGRSITDGLLHDERIRRVVDQARTAQSQVKAAITSIRKTGGTAADAAARTGQEQASSAKSQAKAAATSVKKTADAATGRD